jgi:hypothetical protein
MSPPPLDCWGCRIRKLTLRADNQAARCRCALDAALTSHWPTRSHDVASAIEVTAN